MKVLPGVHTDYSGELSIRGKRVRFGGTSNALAHGIGMIYQELSVIDCLTVAENVFFGKQPVKSLGVVKR